MLALFLGLAGTGLGTVPRHSPQLCNFDEALSRNRNGARLIVEKLMAGRPAAPATTQGAPPKTADGG